MAPVNRKVLYRLYPTPKQETALQRTFEIHREFYNNARQTRINTWKNEQRSVSFAEQCCDTTKLRAAIPALAECNAQSLQVTLRRVDLAFQGFFRRCKAGEKTGFPRYKTPDLFKGWGYKDHGNGWKFNIDGKRKASLRLSGIGNIHMRGKARNIGLPKTMEVIRRNARWYASVTITCEPKRSHGSKTQAFDWGLQHFATAVDNAGNVAKLDAPMPLKASLKKLRSAQQDLSRKKRGSKRRVKAKRLIASIHEKACNQRADFLHKQSAKLIAESAVVVTESLNVKSMVEDKRKSRGLHRNTMDSAPATFLAMLRTKAQEAACVYHEVDTKTVKPTQTCSHCGAQKQKTLAERTHACEKCGFTCDRDVNSALVMLKDFVGKGLTPRGSARPYVVKKRETQSIAT